MAAQDKTAVAVCTEQFVPLAKKIIGDSDYTHTGVLSLPFPLDTRPEEEVRKIATELIPDLFKTLGVAK